MTTDEFDHPCPHGGSVVTCNDCLTEYVTAERLVEGGDWAAQKDLAERFADPVGTREAALQEYMRTKDKPRRAGGPDGGGFGSQCTHGDPYLSPQQTNPTATPWDGVEGRDLDRALKARDEDEEGEA